ncbi:MAG: NAD(P)-dependent glycerol-3-phosphate dehydrogenase [Armatimonadetes bacterium]|nr:NAD(P)-dependent glycerol-3-phosphate dehydrogenase [Armatimonadota bacterium]
MNPRVLVVGGGSWGTALAWLLGSQGTPVRLWVRDPGQAAALACSRENTRYLPGVPLPASVEPTSDPVRALDGAAVLVLAVPTSAIREALRRFRSAVPTLPGMLIAAKGLERDTGRRLSEVVREETGPEVALGVLSGPNLSAEVVRSTPTATVIASDRPDWAGFLQKLFSTSCFRVYTNADLPGVELAGALKNPYAIAAGISDGLGYGRNTWASLVTRSLAELIRLGTAAGGRAETFRGLAGLGDLIATAGSSLSRNYRVGYALGQGQSPGAAMAALGHVAEGVPTTEAACRLAEQLEVSVPILTGLRQVLREQLSVEAVVRELIARPFREEES